MTRSFPPVLLLLGCLGLAAPHASQAQGTPERAAATVRLSAQRDTTLTAADLARLARS